MMGQSTDRMLPLLMVAGVSTSASTASLQLASPSCLPLLSFTDVVELQGLEQSYSDGRNDT